MGGPVLTFIKAIFVGAAGKSAAYILAVNLARIGALALIAKLTAPKLDFTDTATTKSITIRDPIAPQKFIYGEDQVSGPLIFANTAGSENRDLYLLVALTGHEIDSVTKYRIDDTDVTLGQLSGAEDGDVTGGKFNGVARVDLRKGTATQAAIANLTATFPSLFGANHTGRGWSYMLWEFNLVEGSENVYKNQPQNLRAVARGYKVYDPRRYALNGDPDFATTGRAVGDGLQWFDNSTQSAAPNADWSFSGGVATLDSSVTRTLITERIDVDTAKRYSITVEARETLANPNIRIGVIFYDSAGDEIGFATSDATGWNSITSIVHFFNASTELTGSFVAYTGDFGPGGTASIPTGAVQMAFLISGNASGEASTISEYRDAALHEYGSGTRHDVGDDTTWEWSENPALCLAHFIMDSKFGQAEESDRIDWPKVITAADICDATVAIPTASTQKRYTCNVTFESTTRRREVRDELVGAMLGRIVFSQGKWRMWAGAAITPDVTISEKHLRGGITLQASTPGKERYNRVRGKYVDKDKDYTAASYPEARSTTYEAEDNNEVLPEVADFMSTTNFFEAQRKSIITLKQSRNQRVLTFEGNYSCWRLQPGTTVLVDVAELGFAGEKFFISQWKYTGDGVDLTLVEEDDTVWADPAEGDYTTRSPTGTLTFTDTGVPAPTSLAATTIPGGVKLTWTNPLAVTFRHIEVWRSTDNVRGNAVLIATTQGDEYYDLIPNLQSNRYYWIRAVNLLGQVSSWEPDLTTTTAIAYPEAAQQHLLADVFIRLGASYWDLGAGTAYRSGEGIGGTDAISIAATSVARAFRAAARRGPDVWDVESPGTFTVEVRWRVSLRTDGATTYSDTGPVPRITVEDSDGSNKQEFNGSAVGLHLFSFGDPLNEWFDQSVTIEVNDTGTAKPRYIRVGMLQGVNLTGPEFNTDLIDATIQAKTFKGSDAIGLVPDSSSVVQTTHYLKADGTWDVPPGGSASNSFETMSVTDTDSGFTWDATGSAVAESATDTLTLVSGEEINIDVDPASDAIRISGAGQSSSKLSCRAATTANITLSGLQTIDGVSVANNNRVLVKNQTAAQDNGIYVAKTGAWTRASNSNTAAKIAGAQVAIREGTVNGGSQWQTSFKATDTLGTTAMTWRRTVVQTPTAPADNQIAVWTASGVIEGNAELTWDAQYLRAEAGSPGLKLHDTSSTVDNRIWSFGAFSDSLSFSVLDDAESVNTEWLDVQRTGTVVDAATIKADTFRIQPEGVSTEGFLFGRSGDVTFVRPRNAAGSDWDAAADLQYDRSLSRWFTDSSFAVTGGFLYALSGVALRVYDAGNTDYMDARHTGTTFEFDYFQTAEVQFENNGADFFTLDFTNDRLIAYAPLFIQEQAAANGDAATFGQIWVRNDAPNTLWFTDDAGNDTQITQSGGGFNALQNVVEDTTPQLGGTLDGQDNIIRAYALQRTTSWSEPVANTVEFDVSDGGLMQLDLDDPDLTGNVTISFTGYHASGRIHEWTVEIQQRDSSPYTVTWPSEVTWPGGTAPVMSTGANAVDVFHFYTRDGGITVRGTFAQDFS